MPSEPLVSVILPVLNAQRFLRQALDSLQAQTYPYHETLVIDGGSTDGTAAIMQAASSARFLQQPGQGLADAWNTGLRVAAGQYIAFLESDDLWAADKLKRQVAYLESHATVEYVIGYVKLFLEPGCPVPRGLSPAVFEGIHAGHMPGTLMARRELFDRVGCFDGQWLATADVEWFARLEAEGMPGYLLPEVLLYRRIHESNLSQVMAPDLSKRELLHIFKHSLDRRRARATRNGSEPNGP